MSPNISLYKNIHSYAIAFSAYWGILLFGYDTGITGGVISQHAFLAAFGLVGAKQSRIDNITSNVVSVLQAGAFFGALGSAPFTNWIGRRWALIWFIGIFSVGAILTTAAGSGSSGLPLIYAGRVISGVGVGAMSSVAPVYVSECAPKNVRGRIVGFFQVFVAVGVMLSYFVNYGVSKHIHSGARVWRIPFGIQLLPAGIMLLGLSFTKESPRWLARAGRTEEALRNLAFLRRGHIDDEEVREEFAEIEATIQEEKEARAGLTWKEAFLGKGQPIRFGIAFVMFLLQQFSGQNSVNYYAPLIFQSIGYSSQNAALLASGVYGVVKVVATFILVVFGLDAVGRRPALIFSACGMGTFFYIIGALLKTHPPVANSPTIAPASRAMAAMLYIYVVCYSFGWGATPWVYVSDIFANRNRHYGLAFAAATQWLFNFVLSKITPTIHTALGWKMFVMFATINILGMGTFSFFLPETKGRSLEDMDIIFGTITAEERDADIKRANQIIDKDVLHHDAGSPTEEKVSSERAHDEKV